MIYMLWAEGTRYFKFGFTKDNPQKRARVCNAYSPIPLRLVAVTSGTLSDEGRLHFQLRRYRVRGKREWYEMSEADVMDAVHRICNPTPEELDIALKELDLA